MAVRLPGRPFPVAVVLDVGLNERRARPVLALGGSISSRPSLYRRSASSSCSERQRERPRSMAGHVGRRRRRTGRLGAQRASWNARHSEPTPCAGWPRRAWPWRYGSAERNRRRARPDRPPARRSPHCRSGRPAAAEVATSPRCRRWPAPAQCLLAHVRILDLEHDRRLRADPERPQPATQLVGSACPQRLGKHVAGRASLSLTNHPLPHQLQPDDHRALPGGEGSSRPAAPAV